MQSNELQTFLSFMLKENCKIIIKETEKLNITTMDQALNYLYKIQSNLNSEEQDIIELFKIINQNVNDIKESFEIIKVLETLGVNSKSIMCEMDEEDLNTIGFSKQMLQQKQLPEAFKNFIETRFKHSKIAETIEKLIAGGIESEDQLFQLSEDIVQNNYLIPKYTFRKWKTEKQNSVTPSQQLNISTNLSKPTQQLNNNKPLILQNSTTINIALIYKIF